MERVGNRGFDETRAISIKPGYAPHGASVIFQMGNTIVHCAASIEESTPRFVEEGSGWITAEYSLMPVARCGESIREFEMDYQSGLRKPI